MMEQVAEQIPEPMNRSADTLSPVTLGESLIQRRSVSVEDSFICFLNLTGPGILSLQTGLCSLGKVKNVLVIIGKLTFRTLACSL